MEGDDFALPIGVRYISTRLVFDDEHARHFGPRIASGNRRPDAVWIYPRIEAPAEALTCRTSNIGETHAPGGLCRALPDTGDLRGQKLALIAERIAHALAAAPDVPAAPAIQRILGFVALGPGAIYQIADPMLLELDGGEVLVREGCQRYLALLLLGARTVEGYDWSRVTRQR